VAELKRRGHDIRTDLGGYGGYQAIRWDAKNRVYIRREREPQGRPYSIMSPHPDTAYVTSKGQVVVPVRIRRKFGIKAGTRLNFQEENGRIVVQPVTRDFVDSFCGVFKLKPGEKSAVQELLEDRARERAREDRELELDARK
jgi:AbrB family looped-hinge helix DNA binding protein